MGSKRSTKAKKLLDTDSLKKDQDLLAKNSQQARMSWKLKYELINSDQYSNGMSEDGKESSEEDETNSDTKTPSEPEEKKMEVKRKQKTTVIAGLSGYLSSSDSDEDSSDQDMDINSEVQAFLKEVDAIKLDSDGNPIEENIKKKEDEKPPSEAAAIDQQQQVMRDYYAAHGYSMPTTAWQECYDSSSGYSYYWNTETNEVRWEIPAEYQSYITRVKQQWEEYHRALYRNQYNSGVALGQPSAPVNQAATTHSSLAQGANAQSALLHSTLKKDILNSSSGIRGRSDLSNTKTTPPSAAKKRRPPNMSDSEDEKIELITSYGPNSDDQSSEDEKITDPSCPKKIKKRKSRHSRGSKEDEDLDKPYTSSKLSHVPDKGPPGVEDDPDELERQEEIRKRLASRQEDMKKLLAMKKEEAMRNKKRALEAQMESPNKKPATESNAVNSVTETTEEVKDIPKVPFKPDLPSDADVPSPGEAELVERLKSQAEVLKKLGGELPEGVTRIISEELSKPEPKSVSLVAGYDEEADSENEDRDKDKDTSESEKTVTEVIAVKQEISKESVTKSGEQKEEKSKIEAKAAGERVSKKVLKLSAKAKKLIDASETTKRARQTDFVNTPLGLRPANSSDIDDEKSNDAPETGKNIAVSSSADPTEKLKSSKPVELVVSNGDETIEGGAELDIKDCSELLLSKMKFLSEGKEAPSPVQIWSEQLEILFKAWEGKHLKSEFFFRWLQSISERLSQLETSAAPLGWLCLWSREERRYCYKKVETGEVVWDFPVDSGGTKEESVADTHDQDAGGEECLDLGEGQGEVEMELCMTPPPPPSPPSPPPPPSISERAPSPPPPPIISFPPDTSLPDDAPPLPEETPPPLPEDAPPPLPEEAPPLPLEEAPPLPPGEPLPPGVEPPSSAYSASLPATPQPVAPPPPATPQAPPPQSVPPPVLSHRTLLPHPPPQADYGHMVLAPAPYHHMGYHQIHFAPQSQYSSAYVSAAPMPAHIPSKPPEVEKKGDLISELDSFYSDLATLQPEEMEKQVQDTVPSASAVPQTSEELTSQTQDSPEPPTSSSPDNILIKKKKKPKLAPGLALKKKGVSSLVAKWQKVQQSARRDF